MKSNPPPLACCASRDHPRRSYFLVSPLCQARAEQAGCHLNLCYLCAPLLLLKQCRLPLATSPPDRIPFNIALTRAMANHPKSRRLSSGGPPIPEAGERGSELKAGDIEAACESDGLGSGLKGEKGEDGRIQLSCNEEGGARCLICRTGVSGWLRVYT
jgi:hypothetical protein